MDLAKMWHLMKAHRKRTKITKITPTWPSPQLAVPAAPPAEKQPESEAKPVAKVSQPLKMDHDPYVRKGVQGFTRQNSVSFD